MDNIIFGHDPLLYKSYSPQHTEAERIKELEEMMRQYNTTQPPQMQPHDYLGELDNMMKSIDPDIIEGLSTNEEFLQLNGEVQAAIQNQIMLQVKHHVNSDANIVTKIQRLQDILNEASQAKAQQEKQNLNDLNDYIKNYSDMTFNEYKKMKNNYESPRNQNEAG